MQNGTDRQARLVGIGLVNLATLTWATNIILGRWLREDIGPLTLAASRFFIASIVFVILLQRGPSEERRLGQERFLLLGMALAGVATFAPTLYLALRFTTAVNVTLINGFGPLITGFLATLLIHEPMSRRQIAGAIVGLTGIIILISGGSLTFWQEARVNVGDLISIGAVTLWGLYSVLGRRVMRHRSALSATAFSSFLGLPLLVVAAAFELQHLPVNTSPGGETVRLILAVLYIGVAPTVIGFLAWNAGVRRLGASGAMVFYNTLPLYGALLGTLFLDESLGPAHLVGGVLIIGGGIWAARQR
jgi:drug/metabolite transporter (DMT)-like permease